MFFLDEVYLTRAVALCLTSKHSGYYITNFTNSEWRIRQCVRTLEVLTAIKMIESDNHLEDYIDVQQYKYYVDQVLKKFYITSFITNVYPLILALIILVLLMLNAFGIALLIIFVSLMIPFYYTKRIYVMPKDEVVIASLEVAQNIIDDLYEQHKCGINHHYRSKNQNILNVDTSIDNSLEQANYQVTTRFTRADFDKAYRLGFCTDPTIMNRGGYTKQLLMIVHSLQAHNIDHPVFRQVPQIIFRKRFFTVLVSIVPTILILTMIAGLAFIPSSIFDFQKLGSFGQYLVMGAGLLIIFGITFVIHWIGNIKFQQIPKAIKECLDTYYPDK